MLKRSTFLAALAGAVVFSSSLIAGEVTKAMERYILLGERNKDIARHPAYRVMAHWVTALTRGDDRLGGAMLRLSDAVDGLRAA